MRTLFTALALLVASSTAWAEEVAAIMLLDGDVQVERADGARERGSVGLALDRADTVITGEESAVVLHLHNNHLVRVDEDLELPVEDIVLLDAPERDIDAKAQLSALLYPDERGRMAGLAEAERVAGWHARLSAASTRSSSMRSLDFEDVESEGDRLVADEDRREPSPGGGAATAVESVVSSKKRGGGKKESKAAPPPAPPPPPPPGRAVEALVADFHRAGPLRECLLDWAAELPVDLDQIEVTLRMEGGRVVRLVITGGLRAPACALEAVEGVPVSLQGELTFRVVVVE